MKPTSKKPLTRENKMKHLTKPTRSFIFIIIITLAAAYGALLMARHQRDHIPNYEAQNKAMHASADKDQSEQEILSTKDWKEYSDKAYPLKLKYPPTWKVATDDSMDGYYVVELTPDKNKGVVKVYVSDKDYFAMKGLQTEKYSYNGKTGQVLGDWVYGFKTGDYFYTFDSTEASRPLPELSTIVATAVFK